MNNLQNLSYSKPGKYENARYEKIHNVIFENSVSGSKAVANEIASLIKDKQSKNETFVLGLATGSSPIKVYEVTWREKPASTPDTAVIRASTPTVLGGKAEA